MAVHVVVDKISRGERLYCDSRRNVTTSAEKPRPYHNVDEVQITITIRGRQSRPSPFLPLKTKAMSRLRFLIAPCVAFLVVVGAMACFVDWGLFAWHPTPVLGLPAASKFVWQIEFSAGGSQLIVVGEDQRWQRDNIAAEILEFPSGKRLRSFPKKISERGAAWSVDGSRFACGRDDGYGLDVFDAANLVARASSRSRFL